MAQIVTLVYSLPISLPYDRRQSSFVIFTTILRSWSILPAILVLDVKTTMGAAEFVLGGVTVACSLANKAGLQVHSNIIRAVLLVLSVLCSCIT